jgi:hypothetical protein
VLPQVSAGALPPWAGQGWTAGAAAVCTEKAIDPADRLVAIGL